jgi:hypothetical protein
VTDVNVANLHLGMALARSGDKAGATAAFNAVTGQRADIAKYWLLYVNSHSARIGGAVFAAPPSICRLAAPVPFRDG